MAIVVGAILVDPRGQTLSVNITMPATGQSVVAYTATTDQTPWPRNSSGSAVSFPVVISAPTTFYVTAATDYVVSATFNGEELAAGFGQTATVHVDGQQVTVSPSVRNFPDEQRLDSASLVPTTLAPAWAATTAYTKGQVVSYQGSNYAALNTFTSGSSFNPANWLQVGVASGTFGYPVITVTAVGGSADAGNINAALNQLVSQGGGTLCLDSLKAGAFDTGASMVGLDASIPGVNMPTSMIPITVKGNGATVSGFANFAGYPTGGTIISATPGGAIPGILSFTGAKVNLDLSNVVIEQPIGANVMAHAFALGVASNAALRVANCAAWQNSTTGQPASIGSGPSANSSIAGFLADGGSFAAILENCIVSGMPTAFVATAHSNLIGCGAGYSGTALRIGGGDHDHPIRLVNFASEMCPTVISNSYSGSRVACQVVGDVAIEYILSGTFIRIHFLDDPSNQITGRLYLTGHVSGSSSPNSSPISASDLNNSGGGVLTVEQILTPATGLLATSSFAPASLSSYTTTSNVLAAIDSTNLTLSLVAPPSGNVNVKLFAFAKTTSGEGWWALLNHTGGALVGNPQPMQSGAGATAFLSCTIPVTGLTPGTAYQFDWAFGNGVNTDTFQTFAQGTTSTTVANGTAGPAVMEAWAA